MDASTPEPISFGWKLGVRPPFAVGAALSTTRDYAMRNNLDLDGGATRLHPADGDAYICDVSLDLWRICKDVRERYDADVIFTHNILARRAEIDAYVTFFVPRHDPRFEVIVQDLIDQLEPVRRKSLQECADARGPQWTEHFHIHAYSGVGGAATSGSG